MAKNIVRVKPKPSIENNQIVLSFPNKEDPEKIQMKNRRRLLLRFDELN